MIEEIRRAFTDKKILISFIIMLICFFGVSLPSWIESADWGDIYRPTAFEQSLMGIFFGGVMLLMPFCASFPYATSQVDEMRTNFFQWKVMRSGIKRYVHNKIIATMFSGAFAITFAYITNAIIWHLIAIPYNPAKYPNHKIYFSENIIWSSWDEVLYGIPILIWIGLGIAITSAVWAFFGLATAIWIPDKVLCTVIPVCIYHLWMGGFTYFIFGVRIASPEALFNDGLTIERLQQSVTSYTILLIIAYVLYFQGVKRRSKYG